MRSFPRHTITWKLEEPPALRRLSLSLIEMAALTGIVLRLYRAVVLTRGAPESWAYVYGAVLVGSLFFLVMATLHLANFTVRRWLWRAPAFALVEVAAEMLTSLALIAVHREPVGSARAGFHDWLSLAATVFVSRVLGLLLFAAVLAGVVQLVRQVLLRRERRLHTAAAVRARERHDHQAPADE